MVGGPRGAAVGGAQRSAAPLNPHASDSALRQRTGTPAASPSGHASAHRPTRPQAGIGTPRFCPWATHRHATGFALGQPSGAPRSCPQAGIGTPRFCPWATHRHATGFALRLRIGAPRSCPQACVGKPPDSLFGFSRAGCWPAGEARGAPMRSLRAKSRRADPGLRASRAVRRWVARGRSRWHAGA